MRVICIKEPDRPSPLAKGKIKCGNTYTVINTERHGRVDFYLLAEPEAELELYACNLFIPLSEIDETELVKERENNLVNI